MDGVSKQPYTICGAERFATADRNVPQVSRERGFLFGSQEPIVARPAAACPLVTASRGLPTLPITWEAAALCDKTAAAAGPTPESRAAFTADPDRYTARVMIAEGTAPADGIRRF